VSAVPQPLAYRRLWLSLGVAIVLAVIVASLVPGGALPGGFPGHDKLAHAGTYLVLMVWFAGLQPRRAWRWVALALLGMGLVLEIVQGLLHVHRMADPVDVIANAAGIGLGAMAAARGLASWPYRLETWLARI
jgi:VanZ family protein